MRSHLKIALASLRAARTSLSRSLAADTNNKEGRRLTQLLLMDVELDTAKAVVAHHGQSAFLQRVRRKR